MEEKKLYLTNKAVALDWLHKDYVLCNELPHIDEELFDDVRWSTLGKEEEDEDVVCPECGSDDVDDDGYGSYYCHDCGHEWGKDEDEDEYPDYDFYQFFITNMTEEDVDYMCKHFTDFAFAYSPKLDCWVWCATDLGTHRSYVMVETDLECAARKQGEPRDLPKTGYYASGILDYIRFDWNEHECKEVFPDEHLSYFWERYQELAENDKGKAFPQFFSSLDSENRQRLIERINQKRHLQ